MKYINRDNFRYLTGHGRDTCQMVDLLLEKYDPELNYGFTSFMRHIAGQDSTTTLPIGSFVVWYMPHVQTARVDFVNLPDGSRRKMFKDLPDTGPVRSLTVCTIADDEKTVLSLITVPFSYILRPAKPCANGYQVYHHEFMAGYEGGRVYDAAYIGITKRGWRTRWREHYRSAMFGSHYRFHRAIRQYEGNVIARHEVLACGITEEKALHLEERLVENATLYPLGLNMVPGGNKGLEYLRRIGAIGQTERISPDERHEIVDRFFDTTSRKGTPNPLAAANWMDPSYAEKVICAGPDRLKPQQIRDARYFASLGHEAEHIATRIEARNVAQVKRLLAGDTYSRIT